MRRLVSMSIFDCPAKVMPFEMNYSRKLARNLEYNLDLPALANSVRRFHDIELSWDEIKDLAEPYIVKKSKCTIILSSYDWERQ